MGRVARRFLLLGAVAVMLPGACLGPPALPMPPPSEPEVEATGDEGFYRLTGRVPQPEARVWVTNWTRIDEDGDSDFTMVGDVADSEGRYTMVIRAEPEDTCQLYYEWYERDLERSESRWFDIPDVEPADPEPTEATE